MIPLWLWIVGALGLAVAAFFFVFIYPWIDKGGPL
jgi:hypothetical protein